MNLSCLTLEKCLRFPRIFLLKVFTEWLRFGHFFAQRVLRGVDDTELADFTGSFHKNMGKPLNGLTLPGRYVTLLLKIRPC